MSNIIDMKLKEDWWKVVIYQYCAATSFAIVQNVDIVASKSHEKNSDKIP